MHARVPNVGKGSLLRVAIVFALVFVALEAAIWGALLAGYMLPVMETTTRAATALISAAGIPVTRTGIQMFLSTRILEIDLDCTAIQLIALYAALVVAYPVSTRTKLLGLAIGVPAILLANLLRLLGVAVASEYASPAAFAFVHDFLFKVVMILVIMGLWAWWLQEARRHAIAS